MANLRKRVSASGDEFSKLAEEQESFPEVKVSEVLKESSVLNVAKGEAEKKVGEEKGLSLELKPSAMRLKEMNGEIPVEEILKDNDKRFVLFPIKHHAIWEMYKRAEASFWTAEELDLAHDYKDWEKVRWRKNGRKRTSKKVERISTP